MQLKEILEHLKELSDTGLSKTTSFDTALNEYTAKLITVTDKKEMQDALEYLESISKLNQSIGYLNITNMIEELESY